MPDTEQQAHKHHCHRCWLPISSPKGALVSNNRLKSGMWVGFLFLLLSSVGLGRHACKFRDLGWMTTPHTGAQHAPQTSNREGRTGSLDMSEV